MDGQKILGILFVGMVIVSVGEGKALDDKRRRQIVTKKQIVTKDSGFSSRQAEPDGYLNICYYCDAQCKGAVIQNGGKDTNTFFKELSASVSKIFKDSGINIAFNSRYIMEARTVNPLHHYISPSIVGEQKLGESMNNFWTSDRDDHSFAQFKRNYQCDVAFYMTPIDARICKESGKGGAANMYSICTEKSYGVSSIFPDEAKTAARLAHELGHLFGMGHDDEAYNEGYDDPRYADYVGAILEHCTGDKTSCPDEESGCIMITDWKGDAPVPSVFSECAKGYLNFWYSYAPVSSNYDNSCVKSGEFPPDLDLSESESGSGE